MSLTRDTFDRFRPPERGRFGDNESVRGNDSVRSDIVDVDVVFHHGTEKAVLVSIDGKEAKAQWLPRSLIEIELKRQFVQGESRGGYRVQTPGGRSMSAPDIKILKVKMRGIRGSAKIEFLISLARLARSFGMTPRFEGDGHNMSITSTKAQRLQLYEFNHRQAAPADDWPRERRALLPDGDVA